MKNVVETQLSWFAIFLTAFYSLLASCRCDVGKCGADELARCARPLQSLSSGDLPGLITTKDDLEPVCVQLRMAVTCIKDYTRDCMGESQRLHFNELYFDMNKAIMELCQDGPYQDRYLKHLPCMQKVKPQFDQCSHKYTEEMQEMATFKPNKPMMNICCSYQSYADCTHRTVLDKCGREPANFTKDFLDRISFSLMKKHCERFPLKTCELLANGADGALVRTNGLILSMILLTVGMKFLL